MRISVLSVFSILISSIAISQEWVELMNNPNVNFFQVQQSFEAEWNGKPYEKGKGYKQFKRWEYFMESRVNSTGERPNPNTLWTAMENYQQNSTFSRSEPLSHWIPLGPKSWTSSGWNPGIGRVNCVAIDPNNSSTVYIGAPAGGCWKSTNGGTTWEVLTDELPVLGVSAIVVDHTNSNTIYIGTGDDDAGDTYSIGVLKSTDGGISWNTTGLSFGNTSYRIYDLIINPSNNNHLIAATNGGVYLTLDGGDNWTQSIPGATYSIEFKPDNDSVVYACNKSVWKSINGGQTFTPIGNGLPSASLINRALIAVSADEPDYIYFLCGDEDDNSYYGLYRTTDAGANWSLMSDSPNIFSYEDDASGDGGQSWYDMALACSPINAEEIYVGGINVWKSTNGGIDYNITSHWVHPSSIGYTHADIHVLETFGNKVYCGSDGGIFVTSDGANNWIDITDGIQISQFYGMGSSEAYPELIIAGAQDNGTNFWSNNSWQHVIGADGMEAIIDWSNPNILYGSIQNGSLQKSTNGGISFNGISNDITDVESGNWLTPYDIDPIDPDILYAGYKNLWKSTDGGNNWFTISNFTTGSLNEIAIAKSNPLFIYVSVGSLLRMTYDGGNNWSTISNQLPGYTITDIAVDPESALRVWVTFSNYNTTDKVYRTDDGGLNWVNISGSLPMIPTNCIAAEAGNKNGVYVGMDVGVFYRNDTMPDWRPFYDHLPNVILGELEVNNASGKLRAATYGRGVWETNLYGKPFLVSPTEPNIIKEQSLNELNIFPNPSNGVFALEVPEALIGSEFTIADYTGKILITESFNKSFTEISLSNFANGFYFLTVKKTNKTYKLLKL